MTSATVGDLLRHWRALARRSQLDLGSDHLHAARDALRRILEGHEPYPAVVLDRYGDIRLANAGAGVLLDGVDPALLAAPNAYRLGLHPDGLGPRLRDPAPWRTHLAHRLARAARATGDARLRALLAEVRRYPGVAAALDARPAAAEFLLTVTLTHPAGDLALHTTTTTFGGPHDVTLAELAVESFFPADDATRSRLAALGDTPTIGGWTT